MKQLLYLLMLGVMLYFGIQQALEMGDSREWPTTEGVITARFDLASIRALRSSWGLFRDRRPELYGSLLTLDGEHRHPGATP